VKNFMRPAVTKQAIREPAKAPADQSDRSASDWQGPESVKHG